MKKLIILTTVVLFSFFTGFALNCTDVWAQNSNSLSNNSVSSDTPTMDLNADGVVNIYDLTQARKTGDEELMKRVSNFIMNIPDSSSENSENEETASYSSENEGATENSSVLGILQKGAPSFTSSGNLIVLREIAHGLVVIDEDNEIPAESSVLSIDLSNYTAVDVRTNNRFYSDMLSNLKNYTVSSITYKDDNKVEILFTADDGQLALTVNAQNSANGDKGVYLFDYLDDEFDIILYISYVDGKIKLLDGKN